MKKSTLEATAGPVQGREREGILEWLVHHLKHLIQQGLNQTGLPLPKLLLCCRYKGSRERGIKNPFKLFLSN